MDGWNEYPRTSTLGFTAPTLTMLHWLCQVALAFGGGVLSLGAGRGLLEGLVERFALQVLGAPVAVVATDREAPRAVDPCGDGPPAAAIAPRGGVGVLHAIDAVAARGDMRVLLLAWPPVEKGQLKGIAQAVVAWGAQKAAEGLPFAIVTVEEEEVTGGGALQAAFAEIEVQPSDVFADSVRTMLSSVTGGHDAMRVYTTEAHQELVSRTAEAAWFLPGDLSFRKAGVPPAALGCLQNWRHWCQSFAPDPAASPEDAWFEERAALWRAAEGALGGRAAPDEVRALAVKVLIECGETQTEDSFATVAARLAAAGGAGAPA